MTAFAKRYVRFDSLKLFVNRECRPLRLQKKKFEMELLVGVTVLSHRVLAVRTYSRCAAAVVVSPHRVELAVRVLQMGRYDSELRSHPYPPAETCFSLSPAAPSTIHDTHRYLFPSTCYPPSYTFTDCASNSVVRKNAGTPPSRLSLIQSNHDGPTSQPPCRVPTASKIDFKFAWTDMPLTLKLRVRC